MVNIPGARDVSRLEPPRPLLLAYYCVRWPYVGCASLRWPYVGCASLRWPYVGRCWPLLAYVGYRGPTLLLLPLPLLVLPVLLVLVDVVAVGLVLTWRGWSGVDVAWLVWC